MSGTPVKRKFLSSAATPSPKRIRRELNLEQKVELIRLSEKFPKPTQKDFSAKYGVGTSTVSDILKKEKILFTAI